MATHNGFIVDRLTEVAATERGEYVRLSMVLRPNQPATLFFPTNIFSQFMSAFMAAGSAAYTEKLKVFGSDEGIIAVEGVTSLHPTDFDLGRGSQNGVDYVLLRLKKDKAPMVDVTFDFHGARYLAEELLAEIAKGPAPIPPPQ